MQVVMKYYKLLKEIYDSELNLRYHGMHLFQPTSFAGPKTFLYFTKKEGKLEGSVIYRPENDLDRSPE